MAVKFDSLKAFISHSYDSVIDVRSPSEFAEDHLPGAISLPVLDDAERARVGTIYKQDSAFRAKVVGAALVARNAARHLEGPLANMDGSWQPLVYCWRGGQRSGSFATILHNIGWRGDVVEGGYQTYRRLIVAAVHDTPLPHKLIVLDGNTGTAKTELLLRLRAQGMQVLDLEGLANHRGSLFGSRSSPQPSQKAFESAIALELARFDPLRPVLVEAESSRIGKVNIPPMVWKAMIAAPRILVVAPLAARAHYLARAYGEVTVDPDRLAATLVSLTKFQGKERVAGWQKLAGERRYVALASELMEHHYDPRYEKSQRLHRQDLIAEMTCDDLSDGALSITAGRLIDVVERSFPDIKSGEVSRDRIHIDQ